MRREQGIAVSVSAGCQEGPAKAVRWRRTRMSAHRFARWVFDKPGLVASAASEVIAAALTSTRPVMIARFGANEIKAVLSEKLPSFARRRMEPALLQRLHIGAGFFPPTSAALANFSTLMLDDMTQLDVLGSWRLEERFVRHRFPAAKRVELHCLEPYLSTEPWTRHLEGKRVLVVHPLSQLIASQYWTRREHLFADKTVLPQFASLETITAVQTIAGNPSRFVDWFSALEWMKTEIDKRSFDVALIGCGAYGFPIAAHVKRSGRTAVHLGGATQILFGIKGKRWDHDAGISGLYNAHWVRPGRLDVPRGAEMVEDGCYW